MSTPPVPPQFAPHSAAHDELRSMRHEMRTPLNAVIGYAEMLCEDAADLGDAQLVEKLEAIRLGGNGLLELINHSLGGNPAVGQGRVDLRVRAEALRDELQVPLDTVIDQCGALLIAVEDSNREEFLTELGRIYSSLQRLRALSQAVEIWQSADGEPSDRRESKTAPPSAGPVSAGDPLSVKNPVTYEPAPIEGLRQDEPGLILVADDVELNREMLARRLTREGHRVTTAADGVQALALLEGAPFDLVLLDILMPNLDGFEVLERMRASESLRHIPVIMISALHEMDSVIRCIEIGAEDYLPKPFNPVLLRARVGASLEKKRLRDRERLLFARVQDNFERLQELEKLRDSLTHMVVHDLRTPLTSLTFGLQLISRAGPLNSNQAECLEMAMRGGENLLTMINDMLDISKMEDGALRLDRSPVPIPALIAISVHPIRELLLVENQTLETDIDSGLPALFADEDKLSRALINLLSNAHKFSPRGGNIKISVKMAPSGKEVIFSVADNGEGIPPSEFDTIFEKFGQVASRKSGRKMSTGLGLTFCKLAVEAHGGHIWVDSQVGRGSTFYFSIPIEEKAA